MALGAPLKPLWVQPVVTDMFSQKFGGASPETFIVQAKSRSGSLDPPGGIQVVATREADGVVIWDSGMVGPSGDQLPPVTSPTDFKLLGNISVNNKGGSITIPGLKDSLGIDATTRISRIGGSVVPAWQTAQANPSYLNGGVSQYAADLWGIDGIGYMVMMVGGVNSLGTPQKGCYFGVVADDGSVAWQTGPQFPFGVCQGALAMVQATNGTVYFYHIGGSTTGALAGGTAGTTPINLVYVCSMTAYGVFTPWVSTTALTTAVCGHSAIGGYTGLFVFGGWTGSITTNATQTSLINQSTGATAAWAAGPNMTVAVKYGQMAWTYTQAGTISIIILGGSNNSNVVVATTQYTYLTPNGSSLDTINAFSAGTSLPSAQNRGGACMTYKAQSGVYSLASMSGSSTAIASCIVHFTGSVPSFGSWFTGGTNTPLVSASLGTGGVVTQNPDGSTTLQFNYGAMANPEVAAVTIQDGDEVLFYVTVQGANSNLLSPPSDPRRVIFGSPPIVTNIESDGSSTHILTGFPSISFLYELGGVGGDAMLQARVRLVSSDFATTFADVTNPDNTVTLDPTPELTPLVSYYIGVTPTNILTPYPGSTSTGVEVTQLLQAASGIAAPDAPILNSVTPNGTVLGAMDVSVTCASPSAGINPTVINVYYRVTGATDWILLLQYSGPIVIANALLFSLADELALNTPYDFVATTLGATSGGFTAESQQSNIISAELIRPINVPGIAGLMHVSTMALETTAQFRFIDGSQREFPMFSSLVDAVTMVPFGAVKPTTRYGTSFYRQIQLDLVLISSAERDTLYNVFHTARLGSLPIYWRDYTGRMYVVSVPSQNDDIPIPDTLEEFKMTLQEAAYVYDPTAVG